MRGASKRIRARRHFPFASTATRLDLPESVNCASANRSVIEAQLFSGPGQSPRRPSLIQGRLLGARRATRRGKPRESESDSASPSFFTSCKLCPPVLPNDAKRPTRTRRGKTARLARSAAKPSVFLLIVHAIPSGELGFVYASRSLHARGTDGTSPREKGRGLHRPAKQEEREVGDGYLAN